MDLVNNVPKMFGTSLDRFNNIYKVIKIGVLLPPMIG